MGPRTFALLALVAAAVLPGAPLPAAAADADPAAERAAREIEATRGRAQRAASAFAAAEDANAEVELELARVTAAHRGAETRRTELSGNLRQLALQRYVRGDLASLPIVATNEDLSAQVRADALLRFFALGSDDTIDEYARVSEDLDAQSRRLDAAKARAERTLDDLADARQELDRRLVELQAAEERRQADATVARLVAARRAEERRREQEAAAAATTSSSPRPAAGRPAAPPATVTGRAGPIPAPRPATPPAPPTGGLVCPVAGAAVFVDTWGAARSGGRRHEGVDMLGARGTPIVAAVAGTAQAKSNRLGGNAVWLTGANGSTYYYAHLDQPGRSGPVVQGDVIGSMGDTGNARGTVHLHWEVHPGGGPAVNPYPYARSAC